MEDLFAEVAERWPAGREDYYWHVLPGSAADRERLAGSFRELTQRPGLVPVRPEWMHVAVQRLGPASGITGRELARMTRLVQGRCGGIAPFTVTVGRAEAWEAGVVCPVRPGYLLGFLRQIIAEVAGGRPGSDPPAYCPHLTLAFAVARVGQGPVRAWISDCEVSEAKWRVARLVLVAQQHDHREITWRVIDEVALCGSAP
jgi:2'-5' RNA ligase